MAVRVSPPGAHQDDDGRVVERLQRQAEDEHPQQHPGHGPGGRVDVEQGQQPRREEGEQSPGQQAGQHAARQDGAAVAAHPPVLPGADLGADDDAAGVAKALGQHVEEFLHIGADGIGGDDGRIHMPKKGGVKGGARTPEHLVCHHRPGIAEKIPGSAAARAAAPAEATGGRCGLKTRMQQRQHQLRRPGQQRAQRRPRHPRAGAPARPKMSTALRPTFSTMAAVASCSPHLGPAHGPHGGGVNLGKDV